MDFIVLSTSIHTVGTNTSLYVEKKYGGLRKDWHGTNVSNRIRI